MSVHLLGLGTATPPHVLHTQHAAQISRRLAPADVSPRAVDALHQRSGVLRRAVVALDAQGAMPLYDAPGPPPTTAQRLERYTHEATLLALDAGQRALAHAQLQPGAVTHLVTASCTGMEAPGFDLQLIERLPLPAHVRRTHVGFMGCHAAINALAVAHAFARADAHARVLVVCAELCSLHMHHSGRADQLVANALFADGAAAALLGQDSQAPASPEAHAPRVLGTHAIVLSQSAHLMAWRIGDRGFEMTLDPAVPDVLQRHVPAWIAGALRTHGLTTADVRHWAIHPGGPRVVRAVAQSLNLPASACDHSLGVLADHGNMSSATVLFILQRMLQPGRARGPCVLMAFGPGLAGEAAVLDLG
jgi:predicted naringenin-chalcone synthase